MLMFGSQSRWLCFVLGASLCVGLSGPAFAGGTVYSWETDDGTISFTDEQKRIPSRYKLSATTRELGSLESYERFTPTGGETVSREELRKERLQDLNGEVRPPVGGVAVSGANPGFDGNAISIGGGRYGGGVRLQVPLNGVEAGGGPTVIEKVRVRPENSMATRTVTVVRQNGKIISVAKGQPTQRSWAGTTATGQDEEEVLR